MATPPNAFQVHLQRTERAFLDQKLRLALHQLAVCFHLDADSTKQSAIFKQLMRHFRSTPDQLPIKPKVLSISTFPRFSEEQIQQFVEFDGTAVLVLNDVGPTGRESNIVIAKIRKPIVLRDGTTIDEDGYVIRESMASLLQADFVTGPIVAGANGYDRATVVRECDIPVLKTSFTTPFFHFLSETVAVKLLINKYISRDLALLYPPGKKGVSYIDQYLSLVGCQDVLNAARVTRYPYVYLSNISCKKSAHYFMRFNELFDELYQQAVYDQGGIPHDFHCGGAKGAPDESNLPRRVYISRAGYSRSVLNEDESFRSVLAPLGFVKVDMAQFDVVEQMRLFREAEFIIGVHGAAFANIVYSGSSVGILEMIPPNRVCPSYFTRYAQGRGLTNYIAYPYLQPAEGDAFTISDPEHFHTYVRRLLSTKNGILVLPR